MYTGKVIKSDSVDPDYVVQFSFVSPEFELVGCKAIFTRQLPSPKVVFDDYTDYILEKNEVNEETCTLIKLKVGGTVFDYLYSITKS